MASKITVFLAILTWISGGSSVIMGAGYILDPNRIDLFFLSLFSLTWAMILATLGILNEILRALGAEK